jgi:hypothetical protein
MRVSMLLVLALLLAGPAALAQNDAGTDPAARAQLEARIRDVELALNRIGTEQQSVYQQFQMVQQMRASELQQSSQTSQSYTPDVSPPNYDDVVRERQARDDRLQRYGSEMDRLYARYRELEEQKRPLLDELTALAAQRR